ncbi:hypothetical protein F5Y04DRAFT_276208 [Hypomontagnella monticulosa]|nr:hypothetical protein F5Y04DRAFT_276208 [Hypomontagnella monticulosa]
MPTLTKLPCEIVVAVLKELDFKSLATARLVCRYINSSFKQCRGIEAAILRHHITPALLPYAAVIMEMSLLPKPCPYNQARDLLDTHYNNPDQLVDRMGTMPWSTLQETIEMYDVIHEFSNAFAKRAWSRINRGYPDTAPADWVLSPDEHFRFCRAFYRVELFYNLFHCGRSPAATPAFRDAVMGRFFPGHSPWENEQLGCVAVFLEESFADRSLQIALENLRYDGDIYNYVDAYRGSDYMQRWLSRGIKFLHKLVNSSRFDAENIMSGDGFVRRSVNFALVLREVFRHNHDTTALRDCSEEALQSLIPDHINEDTDKGPHEAWRLAHIEFPRISWIMKKENHWLRCRAYVLWDEDRMQNNDLFEMCTRRHPKPRLPPVLQQL